MVLWQALRSAGYTDLYLVHVEHGMRGETSLADCDFVQKEAERSGTPCDIHHVNVLDYAEKEKLSLETAARDLRYAAIASVAESTGRDRVFLGHHADDQIETVLLHLFRGTGSRGLAGMEVEFSRRVGDTTLHLLRPLLDVSRDEILRYAKENGLEWREDESNRSSFALRNRIRHQLLPVIENTFGRDARSALLRAAKLAALDEAWVRESLGELPRREHGLSVAALRALPTAQRNRLLLTWLRESGVPDCGLNEVERTAQVLLSESSPAKASLPANHQVRRRAGVLFIEKA